MSITHIHRTGPVEPKQFPVKLTAGLKTNTIESGTLLAFETNTGVTSVVPVTAWVWDTNEQTTSRAFAAAFAGVSSGRSNAATPTDTRDTSILTSQDGEFELLVDSASYQVGSYLKPKKAAGNALTNTLIATTDALSAIFVVSKTSVGSVTRVTAYVLKTAPKRLSA
jgi:hypothetical protein